MPHNRPACDFGYDGRVPEAATLAAPPSSTSTRRKTAAPPRAVIVIPTYNEAEGLERTVAAVHAVAERVRDYHVELLVVDGNSPDGTAGLARRLAARYPRLHVLVEPCKSGLGGAYLRGMRYAVDELSADYLFEFDADLSHDPQKIPEFLRRLSKGADFVVGTRYTAGGGIPADWAPHRKFLSVVGNRVIRLALGRRVSDWTGGFRGFHRRHFERLEAELRPYRGYTFQTAFLHKALQNGARVSEVPYRFAERRTGRSKLGPEYARDLLAYLVRERLRGFAAGLGALLRGEGPRAARMLLVGGLGVLVHLACLRLLVEVARLGPVAANLIAGQVAVLSNFAWNDRWTFADRRRRGLAALGRRYARFALGSVLGVAVVQTGAIWLGQELFGRAGYLLYWGVGTALLFLWNYALSSRLVWRRAY